ISAPNDRTITAEKPASAKFQRKLAAEVGAKRNAKPFVRSVTRDTVPRSGRSSIQRMVAAPSLLRRGRYRAILEQDLRRLRRRTKGVFDFERTRSGPTALVISLSSFPYQLKLEGMLAAGLELHGCRV